MTEWSSYTQKVTVPIFHGEVTIPWSANDGYQQTSVQVPTDIIKWVNENRIWVTNSYITWSLATQPFTGIEIFVNGNRVAVLDNSGTECFKGANKSGTTPYIEWRYNPILAVQVHAWKHGVMKVGQGATNMADADLVIEYKTPKGEEHKYTYIPTLPKEWSELIVEYAKWGFISAIALIGVVVAIKIVESVREKK